jgi:hypothetical protein
MYKAREDKELLNLQRGRSGLQSFCFAENVLLSNSCRGLCSPSDSFQRLLFSGFRKESGFHRRLKTMVSDKLHMGCSTI